MKAIEKRIRMLANTLHRPLSLRLTGARAFSSKRYSARKLNAKYAVQNAQTSVGYLFNTSPSTQLVNGAIERIKASNAKVAHNGDDDANSPRDPGQSGNFDNALDKKKSYPGSMESKGKLRGVGTKGDNQLATISYLFANGKNGNMSESSITPVRRRIKRKDNVTDKIGEYVGNDVLKHQNLLRSMRYLFGATVTV